MQWHRFTTLNRFAKFVWITIAYNLFVIVWGAFVRATGSGAGCGDHWPTCNGEVIPRAPATETMIEFFHRATSGIALLMILALVIWAFRLYPKGNPIRKSAVFSLVFVVISALIGAVLVIFQLVADNDSMARLYSMAAHLINTFLLLGALTLTAWWASGNPIFTWHSAPRRERWLLGVALGAMLVLGASGAIIALGDTLFRPETLAEGLQQKSDPNAHIAVRLRLLHPAIAIAVAGLVMYIARYFTQSKFSATTQLFARLTLGGYLLQLVLGSLNVVLLAPVWMQLVHLLLSDLIWMSLVITGATALTQVESPVPEAESLAEPEPIQA